MGGVVMGAGQLPARGTRMRALVRLDLSEVLRSRWLVFSGALYAALAAIFILVGLRESGVMGFTGMERVLLSLGHTLVVLLPLLALTASGLVVSRARADGALEFLFSHPLTRSDYLGAVTLVRYGTLLLPLLALFPGLAFLGVAVFGQSVAWGFLVRALAVSAALLWSFTGIGLAISTSVREPDRAIVYVLLAWVLCVALLDFALAGAMLQWNLPPMLVFILAGLNPVELARLALLSGTDPTLSTLGPVGYYLANTLSAAWLFVVGVLWPVLLGFAGWMIARRRFGTGDLA